MSTPVPMEHSNATPYLSRDASRAKLGLLTLDEAASELRCSRAYVHRILTGGVPDLPPLPVFHIGRRAFIGTAMLQRWIARLEAREREAYYASGFGGLRDDELECIAGA